MTSAANTPYVPPLDDIRFVLHHLVDLAAISRLPGCAAATPDVVDQVLDEAGKFAAGVLAPLNASGDRERARLEDGQVRTPAGFRDAYRQFVDGGWHGLPFPEAWGGHGLPWTVAIPAWEMWHGANTAFCLCPLLTQAGVELLLSHGSEALRQTYLAKLVSGEWAGTMCLTEPQAGSDVGALRTKAVPDGDHWRITGTKIFITYGDHDLADNIIHMVLARTPGAPPGTKGISLFLIPKLLVGEDGAPGARNDLRCVSLEHKLGIHASPTCMMAFGEQGGAIGHLVGEEHGGMQAMFTMMNTARLQVGLEGLALAERAHQAATTYARERTQGRRPDGNGPARIVDHPDVRRMLATMASQIEAMRALTYSAAAAHDLSVHAEGAQARADAAGRMALLTPLVKAWCTDLGFEIASMALQVHGGMGYIEETGVAQHLRDARIAMIYEGTNGIQALDLVGRKLTMADGQLPWALFAELRRDLDDLGQAGHADLRSGLGPALDTLEQATRWLQAAHDNDRDAAAAGATPYLRLFATTLGGFLLARSALRAAALDPALRAHKLASARFFVTQLLPPASALLPAVTAGSAALALAAD